MIRSLTLVAIAGGVLLASVQARASSPWATSVYAFTQGTAQTSSNSTFSDPNQALGPVDPNATFASGSTSVVQLGQRGANGAGSLTLGFDHSIVNNVADASNAANPQGYDFTVYGNAFYLSGTDFVYREPGFVEVAQKQSNGAPGTFYLLLPEKLPANMVGGTDTGTGEQLLAGYADEHPVNGAGDPTLSPELAGSAGGDGFKLEWAVQESSIGVPLLDSHGNFIYVTLNSIDYIRITDVLPNDVGSTGQITTDIDAVIDLGGTEVPEPTAATMLVIGSLAMLRRRTRR